MTRQIAIAEAARPFYVVEVAPTYHPVTDGITGYREYRESEASYETFGGASWRVGMLDRRYGGDVWYAIRDALGRSVYFPRVEPEQAPCEDGDIPF